MPLPLFHQEPSDSLDPHQTLTSPSACFQPFPSSQQPVGSTAGHWWCRCRAGNRCCLGAAALSHGCQVAWFRRARAAHPHWHSTECRSSRPAHGLLGALAAASQGYTSLHIQCAIGARLLAGEPSCDLLLCMPQDIIKRERSHVSSQQSEGPAGRHEGVQITTDLPSISSAPPAGLSAGAGGDAA